MSGGIKRSRTLMNFDEIVLEWMVKAMAELELRRRLYRRVNAGRSCRSGCGVMEVNVER